MIHPIRAWNSFFFRPTSARPLGLIRILYGLLALINLAFTAVDLDYWFTDSGLLRGDASRIIAGPLQHSLLQWYQDGTSVRLAFVFTATAAVLLTIGWRTKLMSILFYLGMLTIHNRNLASSSGADVLILIFGFNLMLGQCGAAYSVDAWLESRRRGTIAEPLMIPWAMRLIQIQISLVYTFAVLLKFGGNLWLNGTALHYVMNNTEVNRFGFGFLTQYPILINLMTFSALAMELSLAFLIWVRAARPLVLIVGLMLHGGILLTVNIPIFGELMWIGYIAFLTPPEFNAFLRAIDVRRIFRRSRSEAAPEPATVPTLVRIDGPSDLAGPHDSDPAFSHDFEDDSEPATVSRRSRKADWSEPAEAELSGGLSGRRTS